MVDLAVRPHVGVPAIGVLDIPVEILLPATRMGVGDPLIAGIVQVTALRAAGRVLEPVSA